MSGGDYPAFELGSPFEKYKKRRNCRGQEDLSNDTIHDIR